MKKFIIVLVIVLILGAAWYLLSPLFINRTVNEDFPLVTSSELEQNIITTNNQDGNKNLYSGQFVGADNFHQGSGSATVYQLADNSHILRLENFKVTNGPDLRVILAKDPNNINAGYIEIEKLKGNSGNQNYNLDSNLDFKQYPYVIIYCKPFHVVFASAYLN